MKNLTILLLLMVPVLSITAQNDSIDNEFETNIIDPLGGNKGSEGSFGRRLSNLTSFVSLNGYATNEFLHYQDGTNTFNNHYFNLLASAEISPKIFAEIQMEYEYGGSQLTARYAQIDYKFNDLFIIRSGKFLVPAGEFNEYLYPEFIAKTTNRAFVNEEIIPVSWGEVGVQLRGQFKNDKGTNTFKPFYSIYLVNGLKTNTNNPNIRNMRGNALDTLSGNFAFGGNIGAEIGEYFNLQFNYYTGDYNATGDAELSLYGTSVGFENETFSFYGALHFANQEYELNQIEQEWLKSGFYLQASYKYKKFEPVIRYDQIRLDDDKIYDRDRFTFGLNYNFYENCVFKINYELIQNKGVDVEDNLFSMQIAVGF